MPFTEVIMTNRLYVSNLPFGATSDAVRRHFATCGGVAEVELGSERKGRGEARVTMTSPFYAAAAVERLDHASFEGRPLRVSGSPIPAEKSSPTVKVVQQFRERANMTYDLDCAGTPLTIRMFPVGETWRIEARANDALDAVVVTASAGTRRAALEAALAQWAVPLDSDALLRALSDVRAI